MKQTYSKYTCPTCAVSLLHRVNGVLLSAVPTVCLTNLAAQFHLILVRCRTSQYD